ncbi:hypothetical protein M422DRAFT_40144 [Sphaerobolus stellatus SS14]|nr:hypothetical protein M422DRAFT_40144 [Sphaerobolus stellatus SS14]
MPQVLPSFEELLASLDLKSTMTPTPTKELAQVFHYPETHSFDSHTRSSSLSSDLSSFSPNRSFSDGESSTTRSRFSPTIIISESSPVSDIPTSWNSTGRNSSARFRPYEKALSRRRSVPTELGYNEHNIPQNRDPMALRASSVSPLPLLSSPRRSSLSGSDRSSSPPSSPQMANFSSSTQPISTLVRQRQPRHTPRSLSFDIPSRRRQSMSPTIMSPVMIPTLPPLPRISPPSGDPSG